MQIRILGPLEVADDRGVAVPVPGVRLRALLTRLAADVGKDVSVANLIDALWPDDPPGNVANALQSLISRLRRTLGDPSTVRQGPGGYRLTVGPDSVDVTEFSSLARRGRDALRRRDFDDAVRDLAAAEGLWRGEPLSDAGDALYAEGLRAQLAQVLLAAKVDRIAAELELGRGAATVEELRELIAAHPLQESLVAQLMSALSAAGRPAEALAAFEDMRTRLVDALGADPSPELAAMHLALLRGESIGPRAHPDGPEPGSRSNLRAAMSSFVGRETESVHVREAILTSRLTTVVGPGGVGKTRLATEAAAPLVPALRDGVWLVELAPLTDGSMIAPAVLSAFGLRDARILDRGSEGSETSAADRVVDTLAESDAVVVFDNCEHLIGAAAEFVEHVLARCPRVRILATSREPLGLAGEAVVSLAPLELPPAGADRAQALTFPAVQLLVARAHAARSDFAVTDSNVASVVEIVRRLDGLPLAIELAAARLRVLPIADLSARLSDRFRLLSGGLRTSVARHRTLRAVVEWSWDLLSVDERLLAERLAVFPGGFTVAAAANVCADALGAGDGAGSDTGHAAGAGAAPDVAPLVFALADKCLLQPVPAAPGGGTRFRMLETIREYGVERLDEASELDRARTAHAAYFESLAHRWSRQLLTRDQVHALNVFSAERENMLAAAQFLGDSGSELVATLVFDMCWYWTITGGHTEMRTWTEFALAHLADRDAAPAVLLETARLVGRITEPMDDEVGAWEQIQSRARHVADRLREIDDGSDPMTVALHLFVDFFAVRGANVDELAARGAASDNAWVRAVALTMRAMSLENSGDVTQLRGVVDAAYGAFADIGDRWGLSTVLTSRAGIRALDGDTAGAIEDYEHALALLAELGATQDDLFIRLRMVDMCVRAGDLPRAYEQVEAVRRGRPGVPVPLERSLLAETAYIGLLLTQDEISEAVHRADQLRLRLPSTGEFNPMFGHMVALVSSVCGLAAVNAGDMATAARDLAAAYPAVVATDDRPVMASVAATVAAYATALGKYADAAEILGSASVLRGAEDLGDLALAGLRAQIIESIGRVRFDESYGLGRSVSQDHAARVIDPARLTAKT